MKTFRHGGKIGDVIFSLPTIRELGGGIVYLPEITPDGCSNLYSGLKDLLLLQPYIKEVREYPSNVPYLELAWEIDIDFDLDQARLQPNKGLTHIVKRYLDAFGLKIGDWKYPWLVVDDERPGITGNYSVINYTGRHITNDKLNITSKVDWSEVVWQAENPVFIGTGAEHVNFCKKFEYVPYYATSNVLEMARAIKHAKAVYCNQSLCMALVQAIGKEYWGDFKPHKQNCILGTQNEHKLI